MFKTLSLSFLYSTKQKKEIKEKPIIEIELNCDFFSFKIFDVSALISLQFLRYLQRGTFDVTGMDYDVIDYNFR